MSNISQYVSLHLWRVSRRIWTRNHNNHQSLQEILSATQQEVWVLGHTGHTMQVVWVVCMAGELEELLQWVNAVSPWKPRLDSFSERERSCWADDTVYWNSSDFCASVFRPCFLAKIGYRPSVMSHWFFSEILNLFNLAPSCVPNEQNACRNKMICYYSWKNIGLPKWYCSFTPSCKCCNCKKKNLFSLNRS